MKALEILEKIKRGYVDFDYRKQAYEAIAELEALQSQIKIKDTAIHSQRLTIYLLEDERANMQRTHQATIKSYRKKLEELQEPKTCETCKCGESVLSNSKIWCKSDKSPIGNINGLALPKSYGCIHHEPKDKQ